MRLWPFSRRESVAPVMQGDAVLEQLAKHLAAQAFGDGELADSTQVPGGQRDQFIRFPPLARAVTIISSVCAQMVCSGGLSIRDREDRKVENRRAMRVLELLSHSPDGGVTPAHCFIEDVMADYLLDGNALVVPTMTAGMMPMSLVRYRPHGAYTVQDDGPLAYQAMKALSRDGLLETIPARDMIHVRWPLMQRGQLGENAREYFAIPPVTLLARPVAIGLLQDAFVKARFKNASIASVVMEYVAEGEIGIKTTPEQRKEVSAAVEEAITGRGAFAAIGGKPHELTGSPVHEHTSQSRSQIVEAIGRFYGLPGPLMGQPIGQWARGVNEQVMKMAWRAGIKTHLDRLLSAFKTRLLMPGERFEADYSEFVRGDATGIAEWTMAMQGDAQRDPVASQRELRHQAGLPREPDGMIQSTRRVDTPATGGNGNAKSQT